MYGKYTLFYESPKTWGYYAHAQTVCTRPLLGGEGLGTRLRLTMIDYCCQTIHLELQVDQCNMDHDHNHNYLLPYCQEACSRIY